MRVCPRKRGRNIKLVSRSPRKRFRVLGRRGVDVAPSNQLEAWPYLDGSIPDIYVEMFSQSRKAEYLKNKH